MIKRPIAIGLSPNTESDDYLTALKVLFTPWIWARNDAVISVESWFKRYFQIETVASFNAGRSALFAILQAMEIGQGDEVLVQAFTCVAVPNSVLWSGAKPIYVDVEASLNFDPVDAEKKVTKKTRALIVQHTFGIVANMSKIVAFCKKNNLLLIEDCAHVFGATYNGQKVGSFGDAAFFSFGRDKIISSVFGGIAVTNNKSLGAKITQISEQLKYPNYFWVLQQLLHPILSALILPIYNIGVGKLILVIAQKLHLLSFPVHPMEKEGKKPFLYPQKFTNALALLALNQLNKLERYNKSRKNAAEMYKKAFDPKKDVQVEAEIGSVWLRFPLLTKRADEIRFQARKKGILLGNWYSCVIDPKGIAMDKIGYKLGSCPKAEKAAQEIINLPTYPTMTEQQIKQVITIVRRNQEMRDL